MKNLNLLFVVHGSPVELYQTEAEAFVAAWQQGHGGKHQVQLSYLQLMSPNFQEILLSIEEPTVVVPLFLHNGWHQQRDISKAISSSNKPVTILPIFKASNPVVEALCFRLDETASVQDSTQDTKQGSVVLYSHGNQTDQAQPYLIKLVLELQVKTKRPCISAVARGEPCLASALTRLIAAGEKNITILPHFIFSGSWQIRMEEVIKTLDLEENINIRIAQPLRHHPALLAMIDSALSFLE